MPATPIVASTPAGPAARRTAPSGVLSPPSKRMIRERQVAEPEGELVVVEVDAAEALGPGQHADAEKQQGDGHAEALRRAAEQHADREQQTAGEEEQRSGFEALRFP